MSDRRMDVGFDRRTFSVYYSTIFNEKGKSKCRICGEKTEGGADELDSVDEVVDARTMIPVSLDDSKVVKGIEKAIAKELKTAICNDCHYLIAKRSQG